jgi:hypothetical protein
VRTRSCSRTGAPSPTSAIATPTSTTSPGSSCAFPPAGAVPDDEVRKASRRVLEAVECRCRELGHDRRRAPELAWTSIHFPVVRDFSPSIGTCSSPRKPDGESSSRSSPFNLADASFSVREPENERPRGPLRMPEPGRTPRRRETSKQDAQRRGGGTRKRQTCRSTMKNPPRRLSPSGRG